MFPLLVVVRPASILNVRSAPYGSILGQTVAQDYRVDDYALDASGGLWLKIWWTPEQTAYIAGWLCTLVMLAPTSTDTD